MKGRELFLVFLLSLFSMSSLAVGGVTNSGGASLPLVEDVVYKVDINSADASTLQSNLSGVGKAKAQAIVDYRDEHGAFATVDELLEVKGIGQALLDRNRDRLTVDN